MAVMDAGALLVMKRCGQDKDNIRMTGKFYYYQNSVQVVEQVSRVAKPLQHIYIVYMYTSYYIYVYTS